MKKRAVQVRLIKDEDAVTDVKSTKSIDDFSIKVAITTNAIEKVAVKAALGAAGFVVLDTFRKVAIAIAEK